ncbi:MAG: DUF262 domain-containing protein [Metamycoplasmataceae bacterium]
MPINKNDIRKVKEDIENFTNEEEIEDNSEFIINPKAIKMFKEDRTTKNLIDWLESGKLTIPIFQRDDVWKDKAQSYFIETVLYSMPVPSIILFKSNDDKYELIDGQQRLISCINFKELNSENFGGILNKEIKKWGKKLKKYNDFDNEEKSNFDDYLLHLNIFSINDNLTIEDKLKYKYDIFKRKEYTNMIPNQNDVLESI